MIESIYSSVTEYYCLLLVYCHWLIISTIVSILFKINFTKVSAVTDKSYNCQEKLQLQINILMHSQHYVVKLQESETKKKLREKRGLMFTFLVSDINIAKKYKHSKFITLKKEKWAAKVTVDIESFFFVWRVVSAVIWLPTLAVRLTSCSAKEIWT